MKIKNLIEGLNAQQRSVPQLPAQARAKKISVLGAKTDPKHPFAGYMVGADESAEPGKKSIGPDQNDPYEKGWRAQPDAANPYAAGTPEHAEWQNGRDEREAQPNHYDESVTEEFDPDNNPWHVTDVDPMSETDFEVALQGPGGQQLNFVIRPVDFMETRFQRYQIDTMDVRDLQTGKTMHWGSMNDLGQWEPIFDAIDTYFWESPALQARLEKIISYYMDAGEQGKNPDMMPGLDQRDPNGVAVSADDFIASYDKTQDAMSKMKKGVAEATGDVKFDKMLKGITGKKAVAKQQKTDTKQQTRDAFSGMFGGTSADLLKNLKIREQGAAEERNELDTPAVQAALAKMAERHKGEKWSKEQLAALGKRIAARGQKPVKEDDVADFLARGGKITQVKPNRGPRNPGLSLGSRHIGGGGDGVRASRTGRGSKPQGKPVVAVEGVTKEDIITKLKTKLGDYLSDLGQQIKKDPALQDKLSAKTPGDQMGPPVKTITTDDGHQIQIHGNEDDGFRISIKNRQTPSQFSNLDEAVMACEMYCARRRTRALNADYVVEEA